MSFCTSKVCKSQVLRTGASLFFNLDVTHWRSAEAKEGWYDAIPAQCKLETFPTKGNRMRIFEPHRFNVYFKGFMPGSISGYDKDIYHLLCLAFCQHISVSEVVDLDVLDVVPICNIHITINVTCA